MPTSPPTDTSYDAIVIGSGLGGLTAGALYATAGKRVLVLERHLQFGGAATYFKRKGMKIEVGLHEMDGLDQDDGKRHLYHALGLDKVIATVSPKELFAVRHLSLGEEFVMPEGREQAVKACIERFPRHEMAIYKYFDTICSIRHCMNRFLRCRRDLLWWIVNGPIFPLRFWPLLRHEFMTVGDLLQKLFGDDESIKIALCANYGYYGDNLNKLSLLYFAAAQGSYHLGGGHYVKGGSMALSDHLISLIVAHGGKAIRRREVTELLMKDGRAVGVSHEKAAVIAKKRPVDDKDPQSAYAPVIFANAAPHGVAGMLPPASREAFMKPYIDKPVSTSLWSIYLGFNRRPREYGVRNYSTFLFPEWLGSLNDIPPTISLLKNQPAERVPGFVFVDYSQIDSDLTEPGYYLGVMCGFDHYDNWGDKTDQDYQQNKAQWLEAFIQTLDNQFPGIAASIVYKEMATARTVADYLNTPGGAVYGFAQEPKQSGRFRPHSKTSVPGLWLASAFSFPGGGFTGAMLSGENAVRELMGADYPFRTPN